MGRYSYIASYPDLIRAFRYDLEAGLNHFVAAGRSEGRQITFSPESYLQKYPDIRNAYGNDLLGATHHYIEHGFDEGRTWG